MNTGAHIHKYAKSITFGLLLLNGGMVIAEAWQVSVFWREHAYPLAAICLACVVLCGCATQGSYKSLR